MPRLFPLQRLERLWGNLTIHTQHSIEILLSGGRLVRRGQSFLTPINFRLLPPPRTPTRRSTGGLSAGIEIGILGSRRPPTPTM